MFYKKINIYLVIITLLLFFQNSRSPEARDKEEITMVRSSDQLSRLLSALVTDRLGPLAGQAGLNILNASVLSKQSK